MTGQAESRKWRAEVAEQLANCSREEVLRILDGWIANQNKIITQLSDDTWHETVELHRLRAYRAAVANMPEPQLATVEVESAP
jgi:hypothetical protein